MPPGFGVPFSVMPISTTGEEVRNAAPKMVTRETCPHRLSTGRVAHDAAEGR